jgi:hypothetical protein
MTTNSQIPLTAGATAAAASFITAHATSAAPSPVHSYTVAFWVGAAILTATALAVAPLLRPGLAELSVSEDMGAAMMPPGALRSAAAMATDGAPACAELKGTS